MRIRNVLILLGVALFGSCVGCAVGVAVAPPVEEEIVAFNPFIGTTHLRPLATTEVTSPSDLANLRMDYEDVRACLGGGPAWGDLRVFITTGLFMRDGDDWRPAYGAYSAFVTGERWLYVATHITETPGGIRPLHPGEMRLTFRHELIHHLTGRGHFLKVNGVTLMVGGEPVPDLILERLMERCIPLDWRTR